MAIDWMPGKRADQIVMCQNWIGVMTTDVRTAWGVPADQFLELGTLFGEAFRFRITEEPKTGKDLPYSVFTRRKKERFDFDGESGNRVYFCLRYENAKGGREGEGPFGPILSAVIP